MSRDVRKTGLRGFRPGPTQIRLPPLRKLLEAWNFVFRKERDCTIRCSENKGPDQLRGYREADLCLCFRICKNPVFSRRGSYYMHRNINATHSGQKNVANPLMKLDPGSQPSYHTHIVICLAFKRETGITYTTFLFLLLSSDWSSRFWFPRILSFGRGFWLVIIIQTMTRSTFCWRPTFRLFRRLYQNKNKIEITHKQQKLQSLHLWGSPNIKYCNNPKFSDR